MNVEQVNYLNIGLMIVSTIAAFILPFELFLFAYAVLGPLHYLTEISWLHDRGYFTKNKNDYMFLAILCTALLVMAYVVKQKPHIENAIIYIAFFSSLVMVLMKNWTIRIISLGLIVISILFFHELKTYQVFFAVFLPTIMHVFIFTGAFILIGALRGKSISGVASLVVFIICALSFFVYVPEVSGYQVGQYVRDSYATFHVVNYSLINTLNLGSVTSIEDLYSSTAGLIVMRFIAFAYMYHYLNWFSKTSIIKWNQISKKRMLWIAVLWIAAVSLYAYDYKIGIVGLFFLSFLHVFLEFPLDHKTFIGIGQELHAMVRVKR